MGKKREFSKWLLLQESVLIWIMSISFLLLAFYCIHQGYMGSLPWLAAMVGFPWTAYGVSQVWYYKKSTIENSKDGIKYETVLEEMKQAAKQFSENDNFVEEVDFIYPTAYSNADNNADNF
jgi:hypothetical protein